MGALASLTPERDNPTDKAWPQAHVKRAASKSIAIKPSRERVGAMAGCMQGIVFAAFYHPHTRKLYHKIGGSFPGAWTTRVTGDRVKNLVFEIFFSSQSFKKRYAQNA